MSRCHVRSLTALTGLLLIGSAAADERLPARSARATRAPGAVAARPDRVNRQGPVVSRAAPSLNGGPRPALLVIPSTEFDRQQTPDMPEALPPERIVPPDAAPGAGPLEAGVPPIAPPSEYALLDTYTPDPFQPDFRYYFFVNLTDPMMGEYYRDFNRAVRRDQHDARMRWWNERDWLRRERRLLTRAEQAVYDGLDAMRGGDYRQALIDFTLAAELNHGDPIARVHLAQAELALGHDGAAARALRRALELQPKLVPMRLGLQQYYARPAEMDAQITALERRIRSQAAVPADQYVLLGFMQFQRGEDGAAYRAFRQAARGFPKDERVQMYLTLTKPAVR